MEITKKDIGKKVYFVDRHIEKTFVAEYGEITAVVPKYNFQDRFAQNYSRNENILIKTKEKDGNLKSKVVNDNSLIFETVAEILKYCKDADVVFGYSALKEVEF